MLLIDNKDSVFCILWTFAIKENMARVKCMSDQRRPMNSRKWDKRQFESFTKKLALDPLSPLGCMQVLNLSSAPPADGVTECVVPSLIFFFLTNAGQSRSGTSPQVMRLCLPVCLRNKQQSTVWLFPGESAPVKFKRSWSSSKQMTTVFFTKSGHVASVSLMKRKTVKAKWYINTCLPKVFNAWVYTIQMLAPTACCSTI